MVFFYQEEAPGSPERDSGLTQYWPLSAARSNLLGIKSNGRQTVRIALLETEGQFAPITARRSARSPRQANAPETYHIQFEGCWHGVREHIRLLGLFWVKHDIRKTVRVALFKTEGQLTPGQYR